MGCKDKRKPPTHQQQAERLEGTRADLRSLHVRLLGLHGQDVADEAILRHRLSLCCRASKCGRFICEDITKAPGVRLTFCVATGIRIELYPALMKPDFACPRALF